MQENELVQRLQNAEGVIWDLDNTLYRFEGDFEALCHVAAAKAAVKCGLDMSHEQALELCYQSYEEFGHSYWLFIERYKIEQRQIHFDFHSFIDEKLIRSSLDLAKLFEAAPLRHTLVTHASAEWAERALAHIGLKRFFADDMIIPAEATNFMRKSESHIPFEQALALLDLPPEKVVVVEDIAANLRIPREMGMATVLVHYGQKPNPVPDYVSLDCNNAAIFLQKLMDCRAA